MSWMFCCSVDYIADFELNVPCILQLLNNVIKALKNFS